MEAYKGGLKGHWKRRGYRRIEGGDDGRRRRKQVAEHDRGGGGGRRRRSWRIRISPKLGFLRRVSPRRILARLRDAYVRMMLRLASAASLGYGYGGNASGFGRTLSPKEYDEKVMVEIYKSLVAAAAAGGGSATVALRR